jgi:hypothetical protein
VPVHQRLGADRLLGGDEVGDDGAQHLEAAIIGDTHGSAHPLKIFRETAFVRLRTRVFGTRPQSRGDYLGDPPHFTVID